MSLMPPRQSKKSIKKTHLNGLQHYVIQHVYALSTAIRRFSCTPVATFITVLVIGISLALPGGFLFFLHKAETIASKWENGTRISLFLEKNISPSQADDVLTILRKDLRFTDIHYFSSDEVLADFKKNTGLVEAISVFSTNPLPAMIELKPNLALYATMSLDNIINELQALSYVETAQLDVQWIERLLALLSVAKRVVFALIAVLGFGVILIIANTIRLVQEMYSDELEVMKLLGASNAFVRRPFLYAGMFYGVLGGIIAWLCLDFFLLWLKQPIESLLTLYDTSFVLDDLGIAATAINFILAGALLGLVGSYIAVTYFLYRYDKQSSI